jgi:hypothetical protein
MTTLVRAPRAAAHPVRALLAAAAISLAALALMPGVAAAEKTASERQAYVESGAYIAEIEAALVPAKEWIVERSRTTVLMTERCHRAGYAVGSSDPGPDPDADYTVLPEAAEPTPAPTVVRKATPARCAAVEKLAIGLDVDETALSNFMVGTAHPEYTIISQGLNEISGRSVALQPVFELYELARRYGVSVFFITAREDWMRGITYENLQKAGYTEIAGLYTKPILASDKGAVKAAQRSEIELRRGYSMIGMVGDSGSDVVDGWMERGFKIPTLN